MVVQLPSHSTTYGKNWPVKGDEDVLFRNENRGSTVKIPNIWALAKRRWRTIVACVLVGLVLAILATLLMTPLYTSTASILLDTRQNQNLKTQNIVDDTPVDTSAVDSQANVLSSDSVALSVIDKLDLSHDPEFVGPPKALGASILYSIGQFAGRVTTSLGLKSTSPVDEQTLLRLQALETFSKRLIVKRQELSYVIDVSFAAESPTRAAQIVNAITNVYIASDLQARIASTKSANQWLQDRLLELKSQATGADQTLQKYKSDHNIIETGRGLLDQQTVSDLNTQLIAARAAAAEAKARLDRLQDIITRGIPDATVTDALNSNVITRLRAQYLDLSGSKADLVRKVGSGHSSVTLLQGQMNDIANSIIGEEQRIADAYKSDYEIAKVRQGSLEKSLAQMVNQSALTNEAQVRARDLESSADAYRNIYNSFLQKSQGTEQAQTIPVNESRVVGAGQVPLKKSSPRTLLNLAGGIILGLLVGCGTVLASELTADVYRSSADVEDDTGLRCLGILPDLSSTIRKSPIGPNGRARDINEWIIDAPYSRFSETVRNIYFSLSEGAPDLQPKVIGVVSAVAHEGKSTVAANLGALIAPLGRRTLLIDGDMHERFLTKMLAPDATAGLLEAVADPQKLQSFVTRRARTNIDVLACVSEDRIVNAAQILESAQMSEVFAVARQHYDVIIIEFAPILSVVDVKAAGHHVDKFVFVVKWGESKKKMVREVLVENANIHDRIAGIVLNNADPNALRILESYKGRTFSNYYRD